MKFKSYQLKNWILVALEANEFIEPTKIQQGTFKFLNQNENLIISSPTGTGKTLIYVLRSLNLINEDLNSIQTIVVVPTKELAIQVHNNFKKLTKNNNKLKISLINENNDLIRIVSSKNQPQIVIATVHKIKQMIIDKVNFSNLKLLVLDEADMLIDYGFHGDLSFILSNLNKYNFQKIILSASIENNIASQFKNLIKNIKFINAQNKLYEHRQIKHNIVYTKNNSNNMQTLFDLLKIIKPYFTIIFSNRQNEAIEIYQEMLAKKYNVALLHKDIDSRERKNIFKDIQNNKYQYLVATDLASRGIDIDGVSDVISYNLPQDDIWYLHRSGRTGRQKYLGNSYVIYSKNNDHQLTRLQSKNINWNYLLIENNQLVEKKIKLKKKITNIDQNLKKEISKIYSSNAKVKPGYKKKRKEEVAKLKQKAKRKYIDQKMKEVLNKKHKEKNNEI